MSDEVLGRSGLHVDAFNKLRLIQPELADSSGQLRDEIKSFSGEITNFQTETKEIIEALANCAEVINQMKIAAITSQYAIKSDESKATYDIQRLEILIRERQIELERLHTELEAMKREEEEQKEYLQKLLSNS
ncbi:unnamed protein product [Enterobius vermicularis]|uniref:Intraflagellar transport protein 20 homolog n=1 Tax=Enterobius vermicularis TaxID=51028 RepID=A0A0N4V8N6_ENTVE|nr:unnamed protein product [Enterobius vermicularis]